MTWLKTWLSPCKSRLLRAWRPVIHPPASTPQPIPRLVPAKHTQTYPRVVPRCRSLHRSICVPPRHPLSPLKPCLRVASARVGCLRLEWGGSPMRSSLLSLAEAALKEAARAPRMRKAAIEVTDAAAARIHDLLGKRHKVRWFGVCSGDRGSTARQPHACRHHVHVLWMSGLQQARCCPWPCVQALCSAVTGTRPTNTAPAGVPKAGR